MIEEDEEPQNLPLCVRNDIKAALSGDQQSPARGVTCSESWTLLALHEIGAGEARVRRAREPLAKELQRAAVYPPGGKSTRMLRCPECGRWCPPRAAEPVNAVELGDGKTVTGHQLLPGRRGRICEDCVEGMKAPPDRFAGVGKASEALEYRERIATFRRCRSDDGGTDVRIFELLGHAGRLGYTEEQHVAFARLLRDLESDEQIEEEKEAFRLGKWRPEDDPNPMYRPGQRYRRRRFAPTK